MLDRESVSPPVDGGAHVAPCDDGTAYRPDLSADSYVPMQHGDGTLFLLRVGREYLARVLNLIGK